MDKNALAKTMKDKKEAFLLYQTDFIKRCQENEIIESDEGSKSD